MSRTGSRAFALAAMVLAGCGGGGGGSGGGTPSGPAGTPPDATAATFSFGVIPEHRASQLMTEILDAGAAVSDVAQFTTDIAHRFAAANNAVSITANCAYKGTLTLRLDDRDGDRRASAGDSITAVLDQCGVPALKRAATGTLRVDLVAVSPTTDVGFQATLTVVDDLRLAALAGGPNLGTIQPGTFRGSMGVQWAETATGSTLRALSSAADDWRFTAVYEGVEATTGFKRMTLSRALNYEGARVSAGIAFLYDTGVRGGALRVSTPQAIEGDLDVAPKRMRALAELAGGAMLRFERSGSAGATPLFMFAQLSSAGAEVRSTATVWPDRLSTLVKDPRTTVEARTYTDLGSGYRTIWPWHDTMSRTDVDGICEQPATLAGVTDYRADAVFQRPVAGSIGPAEASGTVVRVQFGRAIAPGDELKFRLTDATLGSLDYAWDIPLTTTRRGASYEIRLSEPLRRGRTYALQSSFDGVNWTGERVIRDAQGGVVNQGSETFATYMAHNGVTVYLGSGDTGVVSATVPSRLSGDVRLIRSDATVASAKWEQLDGVPLRFITPDAVNTEVVLAAGGPVAIGDALLQLTVTDTSGRADRARVLVKAGTHAMSGAAYVTEFNGRFRGPYREAATGPGAIFRADPDLLLPHTLPASSGGVGAPFAIAAAGGQRLAVGRYSGAIQAWTPISANRLTSRLFCENGPSSGSFEVLDVDYAADGSVTRLAVDFLLQCDGEVSYQKGSYRFNTSVPWQL